MGFLDKVKSAAPIIGAGAGYAIGGPMGGLLGASLGSSFLGSGAATDAANISAGASRYDANLTDQQYQQNRQDLSPYRDVATGEPIYDTQGNITGYTGGALNQLADYGRSQVNQGDYIPASNIPNYDPNIDLSKDPSYQFRLNEQNRQINRNMAGMGKLTSGNRLEEIMARSGQMASQEYAAADARNARDYGINRGNETTIYNRGVGDYSRAYGAEGDYLNRLASLSNIGQTATTNTGRFGANAAASQGNSIVDAANAQAAGTIGAANAVQSGIGDITSLATQYYGNQYSPSFNLNAPQGGSLSTTSGGYGGTGMGVWDVYG